MGHHGAVGVEGRHLKGIGIPNATRSGCSELEFDGGETVDDMGGDGGVYAMLRVKRWRDEAAAP